MLDVSKETNIGFLRAAVELLQQRLIESENENSQLKKLKQLAEEICSKLSDDLLVLRKRFIAKGSERRKGKGKRKRRKKVNLAHNQHPVDESVADFTSQNISLESEEVQHSEFSECCENPRLTEMQGCAEESTEIDVERTRYKLVRHLRKKCKCQNCDKIITAKGPTKLVPSGEYSIQMAAQIATDKFEHHIPLERQRKIMEREGLMVGTKTLFSLTEHLRHLLKEVPGRIKREILAQPFVHIDESPEKILSTNSNGYVWTISNNYGGYFQYELTRSSKVAKELLAGYQGRVISDGYQGYEYLDAIEGVIWCLCWAHVRRKFHDAMGDYPVAEEMVDLIDELYEIEHKTSDLASLKELREGCSHPVVEKIESWRVNMKGRYLDSSNLGKAINYLNNHWEQLTRFLSDHLLPLDNNRGERAQRDPVMGRKNFFGFRTINGADVAMDLYTIIHSCKTLRVNPHLYLIEMATRSARQQEVLTPYEYSKTLYENRPKPPPIPLIN